MFFVCDRGMIAQGGMPAYRVVKTFDKAEACDGDGLRYKAASIQQLAFKRGEEALAHRIVM